MQSALPMGSLIERSGLPAIALLDDENEAWPDSLDTFTFHHYEINDSGVPAFVYEVDGLEIKDVIQTDEEHRRLVRTLEVDGERDKAWLLLAESSSIEQQSDSSFLIDDQRMYIGINEGDGIRIRSSEAWANS